jgi:hypothetical protein
LTLQGLYGKKPNISAVLRIPKYSNCGINVKKTEKKGEDFKSIKEEGNP